MSAQSMDAASRYQRLRGYLVADPANLRLALDAAAAARELLDYKSEREVLDLAAQRHPADAQLAFALGINALALRDYRKAETYFDSLLAAGDKHPTVRYNLAYARFRSHDYHRALDALESYSDDDWAQVPEAHKLTAQAAHFVDRNGLDRSISHMRKYLLARDNDAQARGLLALMLFDDGRNDEAEAQVQSALQIAPEEPHALLAQGGIALERQEPQPAIQSFGTVVKTQPVNGRAWSGLAFSHMLSLDFASAEKAFKTAVEHMPGDVGIWNGLAWAQIIKGDLDAAGQSLKKALAIDRNSGDLQGTLAVVEAMRGRSDDARRSAKNALEMAPDDPSARFAETILQAKAGDAAGAREIYTKLLNDKFGGSDKSAKEIAASLIVRLRADRQRDKKA